MGAQKAINPNKLQKLNKQNMFQPGQDVPSCNQPVQSDLLGQNYQHQVQESQKQQQQYVNLMMQIAKNFGEIMSGMSKKIAKGINQGLSEGFKK